jgi:hypothetical protein
MEVTNWVKPARAQRFFKVQCWSEMLRSGRFAPMESWNCWWKAFRDGSERIVCREL